MKTKLAATMLLCCSSCTSDAWLGGGGDAFVDADAAGAVDAATIPVCRERDGGCVHDSRSASDAGWITVPDAPCFFNLSFEGTAFTAADQAVQGGASAALTASYWTGCGGIAGTTAPVIADQDSPLALAAGGLPAPEDGATYLALTDGQSATQPACAYTLTTLAPFGLQFAAFRVVARNATSEPDEVATLELSVSSNVLDVLCPDPTTLTNAVVIQAGGWQTYCAVITPSAPITSLALGLHGEGSETSNLMVLIDDLHFVRSCP